MFLLRREKMCFPGFSHKKIVKNFKPSLTSRLFKNSIITRGYSANIPTSLRHLSESFLNGTNTFYVEQTYDSWKKDPNSVHISWATFFTNLENGALPGEGWVMPPTLAASPHFSSPPPPSGTTATAGDAPLPEKVLEDHLKVQFLIRAYQVRGHQFAKIDPLGLMEYKRPPELELESVGFTEADLDREFFVSSSGLLSGIMSGKKTRKLREIVEVLQNTYCGNVGCEYMHIQSRDQSNWIRERLELDRRPVFSKEEKKVILNRLCWATNFEKFLGIKWFGQKRFGLEGGENLIPGLKALIDQSSSHGIEEVLIGMAHRGRLNVLGNVLRKPLAQIFHEFDHGTFVPEEEYSGWGASGDVKYHLGTMYSREVYGGRVINISLLSNPSHLEAVNPVVEGKTRAKQYFNKDVSRSRTMAIQIHGDAAMPGQGVVYETINMSGLQEYTTGGTIHVIINNQIGFTTDPKCARSGLYCSDPAKIAGAPVFHVNGDDTEEVVRVMKLAADYRATFHKDVCVDLICYRLNGHNEGDEPFFTQPAMYKVIKKHKNAYESYKEISIKEGVVTQEELNKMEENCTKTMENEFKAAKDYVVQRGDWLESRWVGFKSPVQLARIKPTNVPVETLKSIGKALSECPPNFNLHPTLKKILNNRSKMFETGKQLDWATGELLAYGSLLLEGNHVRLSGQDVQRGTFSHRNCVWVDQTTGEPYSPLNNIPGIKEEFHAINSCLSEYSCLGFELGFSLESPNQLVVWEAQFGDFCNGAQIPIDQFISCGEQKWFRQSGLVMLLPHGYEGQGPEHSSARLERFLQLSDGDPDEIVFDQDALVQKSNWTVANISTPANYFHAIRQQIHREYRKPLVIMSPKALLRFDLCKSDLIDFSKPSEGRSSGFKPVIGETSDELVPKDKIRRVIFCTGKIYYFLFKERNTLKNNEIALIRIEQLAPFPFSHVIEQIEQYPNAHIIWAQEEPKNMGAWSHVYFNLKNCIKHVRGTNCEPRYVGRTSSASPAAGSQALHILENNKLMADAFAMD